MLVWDQPLTVPATAVYTLEFACLSTSAVLPASWLLSGTPSKAIFPLDLHKTVFTGFTLSVFEVSSLFDTRGSPLLRKEPY